MQFSAVLLALDFKANMVVCNVDVFFVGLPTLAHNSVMMANFVGGLFLCLLYCVTLNSRCKKML